VHDFRGKAVVRSESVLPPDAPESFHKREVLWNAAETAETRVNSRVGREILVVLSRELDDGQNLELVRGMCADFTGWRLSYRLHRQERTAGSPEGQSGAEEPHSGLTHRERTAPT
jgi:hypothetical protein